MKHVPAANGIFVTGTDTGVGKTAVATALVRGLVADGFRVAAMKPVAAGFAAGTTINADVVALAAAANVGAPLDDVNPYGFAPAIAPHVAAVQAGVRIDLERIGDCYARLARAADAVVVEGAGGAMVPLGERFDMLDIAVTLALPVIVVVGVRLGCLNHAMLTVLAVRARGLRLAGWVANRIDRAMPAADASVRTLADALPAPLLADCAWIETGEIAPLRGWSAPLWRT